jgi:hypothetical protein
MSRVLQNTTSFWQIIISFLQERGMTDTILFAIIFCILKFIFIYVKCDGQSGQYPGVYFKNVYLQTIYRLLNISSV